MLKRTILIAPLVATCLLLSSHAAEASEPGFGAVTVGPPFFGTGDPTNPGSTQPAVHVAQENDAWTSVVSRNLILPIANKAHMKKGYIIDFNFGRPHGLGGDRVDLMVPSLGEPNPNQADRDVTGLATISMGTTDFLPAERAEMVAACTSQANETKASTSPFRLSPSR